MSRLLPSLYGTQPPTRDDGGELAKAFKLLQRYVWLHRPWRRH